MTAQAVAAARPTRAAVAARVQQWVVGDVADAGGRAALQGAADAVARWLSGAPADDLDVWADDVGAGVLDARLRDLGAAVVQDADDPRRLRHRSYAVETPTGLAVVDVTRGDLRVGPVLLLAARDVSTTAGTRSGDDAPARLAREAAVADLLLRKLLRGGLPDEGRLAEARAAWETLDPPRADALLHRLAEQLPAAPVDQVARVLAGAEPDAGLPRAMRRALLRRTLSPRDLPAAWAQRHVVVPAGRHAGPLGLRTRGVLVVLVGTDGAGKSTVARDLTARLEALGLGTHEAYFGMARGNLPGVGLARRLLGVAPAGDGAGDGADVAPAAEPAPAAALEAPAPADLSHPALRKAAAWYYAAEYGWRWLRDVAPGMRRRQVVVADRYVYDLRESPWPGSPAARAAQAVLPDPDVLALPDAPAEQIHARKPERTLAEQAAQQARFRALLGERPARVAEVVVDTSGASADNVASLVAAVVTAAHRPRRARRR